MAEPHGEPMATVVSDASPTPIEPTGMRALPGFDAVARLAASALQVPLVALLLADGSAFWYAPPALDDAAPLDDTVLLAACRRAVREGHAEVVLDAREDLRFATTGADPAHASVAFFVCEPVFGLDGQRLGALFAFDRVPHIALRADEHSTLRDAAALAGTGAALRSYLHRTDPSTRLPHRGAFFADLHARLPDARDAVWLVAVEVAPVTRYQAFVRAMGYTYADALLRAAAARIHEWMRDDMQLYQVAPTRLAVLMVGAEPAEGELDALVARLRKPIDCLGIPLTLQPGVGLLQIRADELRGGDPLRRVMSSSNQALGTARGWARYDASRDERQRQEFFLVTELAAALTERSELELYYQPQVDQASGHCLTLEALARWHHPTLGSVSPGVFVPLAEQAGLMRQLTEWVLDRAMAQLAEWLRAGLDVRVALNVSASDLDPTLEKRLRTIANHYGVPLDRLEIEFTEDIAVGHDEATQNLLQALRAAGVGIAIDDFGIGYSNLDALRHMPATTLKIDQSLVRGLDRRPHDAAIVRTMATLGRELGFHIVMEGVETASVLTIVRDIGCDGVQGFHYARPLPAAAVPYWVREFNARGISPMGGTPQVTPEAS